MSHLYYPSQAAGITNRPFVKYHGNGNDFIIFASMDMVNDLSESWYLENAKRLCDRHRGIGADGIIILDRKDNCFEITVINANGTTAKNCGNGLRCAAAYIFNQGKLNEVAIRLAQKTYFCQKINNKISIAMGECHIARQEDIFLESVGLVAHVSRGLIGNQHLIFFFNQLVDNFDKLHDEIRTRLKVDEDINIGFVFEKAQGFFSLVFERGVGFTNSCGTGACVAASFIAFLFPHHIRDGIKIVQPGGELYITMNMKASTNHEATYILTQIGGAEEVFYGYWPSESKLIG